MGAAEGQAADGDAATQQTVDLRVWRVSGAANVMKAVGHMGRDRRAVGRHPGLTFYKLLGTGSGRTFTMRDADLHHWALLTVFRDRVAADAFEDAPVVSSWQELAAESLRVRMSPLSSRGLWAGRSPFETVVPHRWRGPVAALTRARIRASRLTTFWASVPPVALDLRGRPGLLASIGIGEAPIGLQGTFSIWSSGADLTAFAQRGSAHRKVIADTRRLRWYSEELFARLAVLDIAGTFHGSPVLPASPVSPDVAQ